MLQAPQCGILVFVKQLQLVCIILVKIFREFGIVGESISGVTKGVLHLLEFHAEITNPRHILHNQGIEGIELLLEQTEVVVLSVDVPADLYLEFQQALWEKKTCLATMQTAFS